MRRKFTSAEVFLLFIFLPLLLIGMVGCVIGIVLDVI